MIFLQSLRDCVSVEKVRAFLLASAVARRVVPLGKLVKTGERVIRAQRDSSEERTRIC